MLGLSVYFILRPFSHAILGSFILAYMIYPVYKFIRKYLKNETVSALVVSLLIVLLFTAPLIFIANSLSEEARVNYVLIKKVIATGTFFEGDCGNSFLCNLETRIGEYLADPQIKFHVTNFVSKATDFLIERTGNFIFAIPVFLVNFFIMIFIIYYLLKQGDTIVYRLRKLLPLKKVHQKGIFDQMSDVTYAVIYGHILVSGIQAFLGFIAFWIFDVPSPIFWGFIMFFFALIPLLGTPIVWVPAVIIKAATGHPGLAIGLLISGIIIATIDNFIKPKMVSNKAKVHPVLVLMGVIGGLSFLGLVGIIVGPVVLSIFVTFIEIYEAEKSEIKS